MKIEGLSMGIRKESHPLRSQSQRCWTSDAGGTLSLCMLSLLGYCVCLENQNGLWGFVLVYIACVNTDCKGNGMVWHSGSRHEHGGKRQLGWSWSWWSATVLEIIETPLLARGAKASSGWPVDMCDCSCWPLLARSIGFNATLLIQSAVSSLLLGMPICDVYSSACYKTSGQAIEWGSCLGNWNSFGK